LADRKKLGRRLEGLLLHYSAAIWTLSVFIGITSYTAFLRVVDPLTWFTAGGFLLAGLALLSEGLIIFPMKGKSTGMASAGLVIFLGLVNLGFGIATFLQWFNPYLNGTDLVFFASIVLGLSTVFLFINGSILVAIGERALKAIKVV
jgi:hypothetical protein